MAIVYYDRDADPKALRGKTIAVIGYGSQGHAHAQNLKDSGQEVVVGLQAGQQESGRRPSRTASPSARRPTPRATPTSSRCSSPTRTTSEAYERVAPFMGKGKTLLVAHAFSIHFGEVKPHAEADVVMIAPKAPGHRMREVFKEGKGVPALVAVYQDVSGQSGADRARVRAGRRRDPRRRDQDDVRRGGRDRLVRRAGDPLRRHQRADEGELRHARRRRIPARGRVLRVRERDEAHRRPHLRGRALVHAVLRLGHRGVRRLRRRSADHQRARARGDEATC